MSIPPFTLFGGAFDPPHLGHRDVVAHLVDSGHRVIVGVDPQSALKTNHATGDQRKTMVTRLLRDLDPSRIAITTSAPYAWDWIQTVSQDQGVPAKQLLFTIGADQLPLLPRWHRFPEVLSLCQWGTWRRQGTPDPSRGEPWLSHLRPIEAVARDISSTKIRQLLATRDLSESEINTWIGQPVWDYLKEQHLYGT